MAYITEMTVHRQRKRIDDEILETPIHTTEQVVALFHAMESESRGKVIALYLDAFRFVVGYETVGVGDEADVLIDVPGILRGALASFASSVVVALNHPQDDGLPTPRERRAMNKIDRLTREFGICLQDFIIINKHGVYSRQNELAIDEDFLKPQH